MISTLILFIVLLTILGAMTMDSFVFTVIYFLALSIILGNWWLNHIIYKIKVVRSFPSHTFPGDAVSIDLSLENTSRLPVPWLYFQESISVDLSPARPVRQAISMRGKSTYRTNFMLFPQKRGYYALGPTSFTSGDLLGLSPESSNQSTTDYITVYPRVIPIASIPLRSRSPLGGIKNYQPLNEDPSRLIGKRDYQSGDSLRRIDWKSTAASRKLQVKLFEPSIAQETMLALDLNTSGYHHKSLYDGSELAIVVAASFASWLNSNKQAVGLISNGVDGQTNNASLTHATRSGSAHLMKILETLARIKLAEKGPIDELLHQKLPSLAMGTSLVVITGHCDSNLFAQLEACYLLGKNVILILCGDIVGWQDIKQNARILGITVFHFTSEKEFKNWQVK